MKSTVKRLSEVYCRPKTEDEFRSVIKHGSFKGGNQVVFYNRTFFNDRDGGVDETMYYKGFNRTEIPVSHFLDLLNDSIVVWRLLEDTKERGGHESTWRIIYVNQYHIITIEKDMSIRVNGNPTKVKTYTDILTLIRLI
jgi:hypothetical protein